MKACSICLDEFPKEKVSHCLNCIESGITCHNCEKKWRDANNDTTICTICKQKTKKNVKYFIITINEEKEEEEEETQPEMGSRIKIDWIYCKLVFMIIVLTLGALIMLIFAIIECLKLFD